MFIETICIKNSAVQNIDAHIERMRQTARYQGFNAPALPDLLAQIPAELKDKKVKCTITYHNRILDVSFSHYHRRKINSLQLVEADIDYSFKLSNRSELIGLLHQKGSSDEVLIVKNNRITDTTFSNVVFKKGNQFYTPDTYLLNGTKRQKLLKEKKVEEIEIKADDVWLFDKIFLVNAMLDIEDGVGVDTDKIFK